MDIKERIDGLTEDEAKAALSWLLNYAVENTMCPVDDEDVCKAESKADEIACAEKNFVLDVLGRS